MWGGGETGLNFFIKGPDAWGAKTSAFILGDFTGVWGSGGTANNYNTFNLLIANINFDWANTSLQMGVGGTFVGMLPTFSNSLAWGSTNLGGKGAAPVAPSVSVTQRFDKNWSVGFGILAPYNQISQLNQPAGFASTLSNGQSIENYFRTPFPNFEGLVKYSSDSCGKVGPWQLTVQADAQYGWIRMIGNPAVAATVASKDDVPDWMAEFKFLVPIIPEKNGNKAGALYADASIFMTQGEGQPGSYLGFGGGPNAFGWLTDDYADRTDPMDYNAAIMWGITSHAAYYLTDAVSINAFYLWSSIDPSMTARMTFPGATIKSAQAIGNLVYDVNPAVRFVFEWDYQDATFAAAVPGMKNYGSSNDWRIGAYYFF